MIDTNIFLFYASDDHRSLSKDVLNLLDDYENRIYISSESVKEAIHLYQNGRVSPECWKTAEDIFHYIEEDLGYIINYVKKEHLRTLATLDPVAGHNDPSDRLIIAQAITEDLPLISSDRKFERYRTQRLDFVFNLRR
jgi:PIN domain nuclease of toxin-antitoxin system